MQSWLSDEGLSYSFNTLVVAKKDDGELLGIINRNQIAENKANQDLVLMTLMTPKIYSVYEDNSLQLAVEFMLKTGQDILPVMERQSKSIVGIITENDVLKVFERRFHEEKHMHKHISMRATTNRVIRKGKDAIYNR